jgi:two-component system, NtrC family, sensor histidine kinase HydH
LTRQIVEPLRRVAHAAEAVAGGQLDQSVPVGGPREIGTLAKAFNSMTSSLRETLRLKAQQESVAAVGEFAASLAHEVRNPLASLRLDLELARERLAQPERADLLIGQAVESVERLDRVVRGSLDIARSGALTLTRIDAAQSMRAAAHVAAPVFTARQVRLELRLPDSLMVEGNEVALQQLFLNLLLNAAEASPAGSDTEVASIDHRDVIDVIVRDRGMGIAPAIAERVTEAFFTTREGGTGLGLAVAKRIALAHGGNLAIESSVGSGTAVTLRLRRAQGF